MWEAISTVMTSKNTWMVLVFLAVLIALIAFLAKVGLITIHTKAVKIGEDQKEREIIRQQVEWAHLFIMSLRSKIITDESEYNGYLMKYILERCYDKVVEWITFNHLNTKNAYIEIKQEEICSLVYGLGVKEEFKTAEFKRRMQNWTQEVIEHLVKIREVYK